MSSKMIESKSKTKMHISRDRSVNRAKTAEKSKPTDTNVRFPSNCDPTTKSVSCTSKLPNPVSQTSKRKVEIIHPSKEELIKPPVYVKNETCRINIEQRVKNAIGLHASSGSTESDSLFKNSSVPCIISDSPLDNPKFQSSLELMKNLELLKGAHFDTHKMLQLKMEKDKALRNAIDQKAVNVVNIDPSQPVYSRLQSISLNMDEVVSRHENKQVQLAEKYAHVKLNKDPELSLNDFTQPAVCKYKQILPMIAPTFSEECNQFDLQPFYLHHVPKTNHLELYNLCHQ